VRIFFVLLAPFLAIVATCLESNLLTPAELQKRVPMTRLTDFTKFPLRVRTPDFELTSTQTGPPFSLQGRNRKGRTWRVGLRDASRDAWRSEANGQRIYYFTGYTGATGSGPATWILALCFDELGRPIPFFIVTHGSIADVLDLDGTGPEILEQDYQGNIRDEPGYFVTTLYQRRGNYWYRSDGRHGAHMFPTSEKWPVTSPDKPAVLMIPSVFKRAVQDSSNDPAAGTKTEILSVGEYNTVGVKPESGCEIVSPGILVRDTPRGRSIEMEAFKESLNFLAEVHGIIVLTGVYHLQGGHGCSASILWASTDR
jgi:hypothetical protein